MHDLLQLMYQDGFLSSTELTALRITCRDLRENPVRVMRSLNIVSQPEIQGLLQRFYGCDAVTEELIENIGDEQRSLLPVDLALHYNAVGIADEGREMFLMLEDPTEKRVLESLEFFLGKRLRPVVATASQLARALSKVYGVDVADLRLTTVLEASRGVAGGVVYDLSQVAERSSKEDGFLVDHGSRVGLLGEASSRHRPELAALSAAAEPFGDDSGSDALGSRLAQALEGEPGGDARAVLEQSSVGAVAVAAVAPVVAPDPSNPTKSVFDDFEGMEFLENIDDSVASANDALLVSAEEASEEASEVASFEASSDPFSEEMSSESSTSFDEPREEPPGEMSDEAFELAPEEAPEEAMEEAVISKTSVSKALVKVALARSRQDALLHANALLQAESVEILSDSEGTLSVRHGNKERSLQDVTSLDTLAPSLEPLKPLLKQIFRLRAVG